MDNYRKSIEMLLYNPKNHLRYAIDKYWFKLQLRDNWFLITPLTVIQREGYSDIEKKNTNYTSLLLNLDKPNLLVNHKT
jgi:hypothetical protein